MGKKGIQQILHAAEPLPGTVDSDEFFLDGNPGNHANGALLAGIHRLSATNKIAVDCKIPVGAAGRSNKPFVKTLPAVDFIIGIVLCSCNCEHRIF